MDYVQAISRVDREGGNGSWRFSIHPWAETDQIDLEAWRASVDASSNTQRIRLFLNTHTANTHTRDITTRNKVRREREKEVLSILNAIDYDWWKNTDFSRTKFQIGRSWTKRGRTLRLFCAIKKERHTQNLWKCKKNKIRVLLQLT